MAASRKSSSGDNGSSPPASRRADGEPAKKKRSKRRPVVEPEIYDANVRLSDIDDDALKVIRRLRRNGYLAYLVGGGVRDLLFDVRPKDFDIATSARPPEVRALFRNCRIIGRRFRLAHIMFGRGKIIETATFRRDPGAAGPAPAGKGRKSGASESKADLLIHRDNVFGEPHEDARRRDFTINGLFYDTEDDTVIDYVGGMADIEDRVVRTIGLPDVRFREDPVRMLRAIKFSARLDLGIHPDVYDALVAQRGELARAARPRLLEEIFRLLRGGAAHRSFWLLWETGALGVLIEALAVHLDDDSREARGLWARLGAIDARRQDGELPTDAVLFAALMYGPIEEAMAGARDPMGAYDALMEELVATFAVPRRMKERIRLIVGAQARLESGKLGSLPRRDYFHDAADLLSIEYAARGLPEPEWMSERVIPRPESSPRPRRRRRRRRRH